MKRIRVIPVLSLYRGGLVKTVKFGERTYVGDPINAVKIFNEKEVDELILVDIGASVDGTPPNIPAIRDIVSESFMPIGYGGGVTTMEQIEQIFAQGVEKIALNTSAIHKPELIEQAAQRFGSQSVVASIDVKKVLFGGYKVLTKGGKEKTEWDPVKLAQELERRGAGEILLNSIDRDGTFEGYDADLISRVSKAVKVPVVALGGAKTVADLAQAVKAGASAVAASSMFVFHGPHRAVLINFPTEGELKTQVFGAR